MRSYPSCLSIMQEGTTTKAFVVTLLTCPRPLQMVVFCELVVAEQLFKFEGYHNGELYESLSAEGHPMKL